VDWEDNKAMNAGTGEDWLIKFTKAVRAVIPNHILSHAPQAPYFKNEYYKNGGYITVNSAVGDMIDFYMIQFYNQVNSKYNTYEELFIHASGDVFNGTAVKEIAARGVPLQKLVVGKPVTWRDVSNTGFVNQTDLGQWAAKAHDDLGWYAGIGHWQYPSDLTGKSSFEAGSPLQEKCKQSQKCK
jgi:chitinase